MRLCGHSPPEHTAAVAEPALLGAGLGLGPGLGLGRLGPQQTVSAARLALPPAAVAQADERVQLLPLLHLLLRAHRQCEAAT